MVLLLLCSDSPGFCVFFRLVRTIPKLQLLVNVLLKSIPSIGHVATLMSIIFYIYATMGVFLFGENDPVHFGDLTLALLSLFRVVTLEDWTDIMYINIHGCDHEIWGYAASAGVSYARSIGLDCYVFLYIVCAAGHHGDA